MHHIDGRATVALDKAEATDNQVRITEQLEPDENAAPR